MRPVKMQIHDQVDMQSWHMLREQASPGRVWQQVWQQVHYETRDRVQLVCTQVIDRMAVMD